jgi:beta-glucanase (GH16 family)
MNASKQITASLLFVLSVSLGSTSASATTLFSDDFDGTALDTGSWKYWPVWLDPTQMRDAAHAGTVEVSGGTLKLPLELYNPTALTPGDSFYGTDITTKQAFASPDGIQVRARMRVVDSLSNPIDRGIIAAMFLFEDDSQIVWDEIDAPEILTNDVDDAKAGNPAARRVLTNVMNDFQVGDTHSDEFVPLPDGLTATDFVVYTMRWLPDRVEWYIDDMDGKLALVRTETNVVPDEPMNLHFNIHVPSCAWAEACDPSLQPVDNPGDNRLYFLEVDSVEVTQVPEPSMAAMLAALGVAGTAVAAARRIRKRLRER